MKNFIIKMRNMEQEEYKIQNKHFVTFPEAVSYAYMEKAKLGPNWEITSVVRLQDVN